MGDQDSDHFPVFWQRKAEIAEENRKKAEEALKAFHNDLRDQFAAAALQGIISATANNHMVSDVYHQIKGGALEAAAAYQWADAMMTEREKRNGR